MPQKTKRKGGLSTDVRGRYVRSVGKYHAPSGRNDPRRFVLGRDPVAAQEAAARLKRLWLDVKANAERESNTPLWDGESTDIALRIAKGERQIVVPMHDAIEEVMPAVLYDRVADMKKRYPSVAFVPDRQDVWEAGRQHWASEAERHAGQSADLAKRAHVPTPKKASGKKLYHALDAYQQFVKSSPDYVRQGQITAWGKRLCEWVERQKDAHKNIPIEEFDYSAIKRMRDYWVGRPKVKNKKNARLAISSIKNCIKSLRMFIKWLHREPAFDWRKPEDVESAWACNYQRMMTSEEIAKLHRGVSMFKVEHLTPLFRYATDYERVLMLLGLNFGFAQAEIFTLRHDELHFDENPPKIRRVRRKTRVYSEWAVWPETIRAIEWLKSARTSDKTLVVVSDRGGTLDQQAIANVWRKVFDRVPDDERPPYLSFKHLRKTASQMIRDAADGETTAVFLAHGNPVPTDDLAGHYSNPNFDRVDKAIREMRQTLQPMFDAAPNAFTSTRPIRVTKPYRKLRGKAIKLHAEGVPKTQIADCLKVSRPTVYRWLEDADAA